MTYDKPPCPKCCDASKVKTKGGGSKGMYRYVCESVDCDTEWQQVPPHKMIPGQVSKLIMKSQSRRDVGYKCGKCGAMKLGHKCSATSPSADKDGPLSLVQLGEAEVESDLLCSDEFPPLALFQQPQPFSNLSSSNM